MKIIQHAAFCRAGSERLLQKTVREEKHQCSASGRLLSEELQQSRKMEWDKEDEEVCTGDSGEQHFLRLALQRVKAPFQKAAAFCTSAGSSQCVWAGGWSTSQRENTLVPPFLVTLGPTPLQSLIKQSWNLWYNCNSFFIIHRTLLRQIYPAHKPADPNFSLLLIFDNYNRMENTGKYKWLFFFTQF